MNQLNKMIPEHTTTSSSTNHSHMINGHHHHIKCTPNGQKAKEKVEKKCRMECKKLGEKKRKWDHCDGKSNQKYKILMCVQCVPLLTGTLGSSHPARVGAAVLVGAAHISLHQALRCTLEAPARVPLTPSIGGLVARSGAHLAPADALPRHRVGNGSVAAPRRHRTSNLTRSR